MITAELTKGQIQAVLEVVPKNDVRYYLNGACLDADRQLAVATDGHMLIAVRVEMEGQGQAIIGRDTLEQAVRAIGRKDGSATFDAADGRMSVVASGTRIAADLVDGTYPDYPRVIPSEPSGELAQFNPEYLAKLAKAFKRLGAKTVPMEVAHNGGKGALIVHTDVENALAVCMPFRPSKTDAGARARTLLHGEQQAAA